MTRVYKADPMLSYKKLFASVVLTALDDAIVEENLGRQGVQAIGRWARSQDGQMVLGFAGINPSGRCISGLEKFVSNGVKTSVALSKERGSDMVSQVTKIAS